MKLSPNSGIKLSKRLQQIDQMVASQHYKHIWDCCCDHGLLGFSLLSRCAADNIHLVDIVPELMVDVESKLQRFYSSSSSLSTVKWQTHCIDVAKLPLKQHDGKHLIIIAGVGGDLMVQFIEAIYQQHPNLNIDFLLCPVHHQFSLRSTLIALDFSLKEEVLVEDNRRFYEILLVSTASENQHKISPVGEKIWQSLSSTHDNQQAEVARKYLDKTLNHYQRMQQGFQPKFQPDLLQERTKSVQHIIDAYSAITL